MEFGTEKIFQTNKIGVFLVIKALEKMGIPRKIIIFSTNRLNCQNSLYFKLLFYVTFNKQVQICFFPSYRNIYLLLGFFLTDGFMDSIDQLLLVIKAKSLHLGRFLGLLNLLVAYKISDESGKEISLGLTFKQLSEKLKKNRWNPEDIEALGLKSEDLPQRDRLRFWFVALVRADIGGSKAIIEADTLAKAIKKIGYNAQLPQKN